MTIVPGPTAVALWLLATGWLAAVLAGVAHPRQHIELAEAMLWLRQAAAIFAAIQIAAAVALVVVL